VGFSGFNKLADGLEKLLDSGQKTVKKSKDFRSLTNEQLQEKLHSEDYTDRITASKLLLERGYNHRQKG